MIRDTAQSVLGTTQAVIWDGAQIDLGPIFRRRRMDAAERGSLISHFFYFIYLFHSTLTYSVSIYSAIYSIPPTAFYLFNYTLFFTF